MQRRPTWLRSARAGLRVSLIMLICIPLFLGISGMTAGWLLIYGDLPVLIPKPNPTLLAEPSNVYDGAGNKIGTFREYDISKPVTQEEVPEILKDAVVAAEDRNFWEHEGVDPIGIARAALTNFNESETQQGGSTITQQYIKKTYLSTEKTYERKLNEAILAARLEREMSKEDILWHYLDTTYFGGGAYGVGAAAETYFRKNVGDLTVSESATLAGVIPAPSRYGPRDNMAEAERRRKEVLQIMLEEEMIDKAAYEEAKAQTLWPEGFGPPPGPATVFWGPPAQGCFAYCYYVDYVENFLVRKYGPDLVYRGGLKIETALDPVVQGMADEVVGKELSTIKPEIEISLVSVEPNTGLVKALVGGRDWNVSQVNLAVGGDLGGSVGFQPGSSFKTFTLVTALEQGYTPDTIYPAPGILNLGGGATVRGGTGGAISLRAATSGSVNTVFAQLAIDVGPNNVAATAGKMGVESLNNLPNDGTRDFSYTITLGSETVSPLDMAAGYAVLANHGVRAPATPILRLTKPDGTVIEDNSQPHGDRVLNAAVADTTTDMLTGVINGGTGKTAKIGRPAAGKTGSAQRNTAAWFVGYTPQLSTAVWIGYRDLPQPLRGVNGVGTVYGGTIPAKVWSAFMKKAHEGHEVVEFTPPGFLPGPSGDVRVEERKKQDPAVTPPDCGGPCDRTTVLTSPPPPPPPPPEEEEGEDDDEDDKPTPTTKAPTVDADDTPDFTD